MDYFIEQVQEMRHLEDEIFCQFNGVEHNMGVVRKMYDSLTSIPTMRELVDLVDEYNDCIALEMTERELHYNCRDCKCREDCWVNGKVGDEANDEDGIDSCEVEVYSAIYDYLSYNYEIYDAESLLMEAIKTLGFAVIIDGYSLQEFYQDVPLEFFKDFHMLFNDAQIRMFPEWNPDWQPRCMDSTQEQLFLIG